MRWLSLRSSAWLASGLIAGAAIGIAAQPIWRSTLMVLHQEAYGELTYRCDSAMRTHYLAKASIDAAPSADSVRALQRAEIALIDCQDYDLYQKHLMLWGLTETDLGIMRLKAIESDAEGLRNVVEAHEIRD